MPPKKKQARNAFYWFMQDIIPDLRREGRVFPNGMQDVVPVATPRWKALSEKEREKYENKAKLEKKRARQAGSGRLDNIGNIIGERGDEQAELERRRQKEKKWVSSHWPKGDDIKDYKFYFVSFEYLCETEEGDFLPAEVGLIEWSLNQGITKTLHRFINPGGIPLGYRYTCQSRSDDTHQIPVTGFELASSDYRGLWIQMENFVNPNGEKEEYPPMFFLGNERKSVEYCMEWLHAHACLGIPNRLHRLFFLENMIVELYAHKLSDESISPPTRSAVVEMLTTSVFDYEANTRCAWHEEQQVKYCALGTVKRFAFALSDALSPIYDFELTAAHLPTRHEEAAVAYTIIPPSAIQLDTNPIGGRSRGRGSRQGRGDMGLNNGSGFGGRDVRYKELREGGRGGNDATGWGSPKSNAWSGEQRGEQRVAPASPWGRPGAAQDHSASESMSEWPSLGGGATGDRFAGRTSAPEPSELPTPGWPNRQPDEEEEIDNRPTLGQAVQQRQDSRPTLGQAVQQRQDSRPTLGQAVQQRQDSRPTLGQAVQQRQDSRPTLGQAVQQRQQDSRPTLGQAVQQRQQDSRPTLGQAVQQRQQDSRPTLGQAVQQRQQDSRPTLGQAVQQRQQDSRPTLGQAVQQRQQDSRPTLGQAVQQRQQDSRPTLGQAVQQRQDSRPTLGQAVQQRQQDSRPTLGEAVQQRQDSRPTLGEAVQQTTQSQPPTMQQQQVCGRGMGILGMWGNQPQRPGMRPQNPPASNPWGTAPGQQPATVPLAGLGRGRGLFNPASGQPVRQPAPAPGAAPTAQPGITRPPPGFGLGISEQFSGLGMQPGQHQ